MMRILLSFVFCIAILAGCNQYEKGKVGKSTETFEIHNPTAEEILSKNPDTDMFQFNGIVYSNARNIEWVQPTKLTTGEMIGTITKQYQDGFAFEDGMATKLPVGTAIFKPLEGGGILIVKLNEKEIRYLGLIEG